MRYTKQKRFTDEASLLSACGRQEPQAQQQLYERFAPKMLSVCLRYLKDPMLAEDMMIQGFVKAFQHLSNFRQEGSFEGWLRRIMVNECLNEIRRHRAVFLSIQEEENAASLPAAIDEAAIEAQLSAQDLMVLIAALPEGYRTVFNLYAIEGYSHQEIATMLAISEGTSKSQLSRARAILQKQLSQITPSHVSSR
nr:sigma-70 family RNA polymerase sigma factor [Eisenibacter elegans]